MIALSKKPKATKTAASQPVSALIAIPASTSTIPNISAFLAGEIIPEGIGRLEVLAITISISLSMYAVTAFDPITLSIIAADISPIVFKSKPYIVDAIRAEAKPVKKRSATSFSLVIAM
mgnify:CR=1 FL=1